MLKDLPLLLPLQQNEMNKGHHRNQLEEKEIKILSWTGWTEVNRFKDPWLKRGYFQGRARTAFHLFIQTEPCHRATSLKVCSNNTRLLPTKQSFIFTAMSNTQQQYFMCWWSGVSTSKGQSQLTQASWMKPWGHSVNQALLRSLYAIWHKRLTFLWRNRGFCICIFCTWVMWHHYYSRIQHCQKIGVKDRHESNSVLKWWPDRWLKYLNNCWMDAIRRHTELFLFFCFWGLKASIYVL